MRLRKPQSAKPGDLNYLTRRESRRAALHFTSRGVGGAPPCPAALHGTAVLSAQTASITRRYVFAPVSDPAFNRIMKAATRQLVFHVLGQIPGAEWSGWSKGVHKRHHLATLRIGQPTGRNIYLLKLHRNRNSQDPRSKRSHAQGVLVHLAMSRVACSFLSVATLAAVFSASRNY